MANFCKDCQFHEMRETSVEMKHVCMAIPDLVTGKPAMPECKEERYGGWQCGPAGTLFKQRGEAGDDPRKQHGTPPTPDISGGHRRDLKPGKSDDPAKFLSVP